MEIKSVLQSFFSQYHIFSKFKNFSSLSPSDHLVDELSRILSDFRNPQDDIESALAPYAPQITAGAVESVLKRCKNIGFSAHRFFTWAQKIPNFSHSRESHHILIDVLGSSRQFPFLWDFLLEMKRNGFCEISREIFWVVFRAYSRANLPADAVRAFHRMADFGLNPSLDDLDQLLYSLCKRKHVRSAHDFFAGVVDAAGELTPGVKSYSILIRGWGEIGESAQAKKLFDEMLQRGFKADLLAWNSIMDTLCRGGEVDIAYETFLGMKKRGIEPDAYSYSIFIRSSCSSNDIQTAFRILDSMKRHNLVANVFTYNSILKTLCKNGKIEEAYELLDEMSERGVSPDTWSYNTILAFHCDHNEVNRALKLITRMNRDVGQAMDDRHTYNMVLKMLIRIGRFDRVEDVWDSMEKKGFHPSVSTYSVLIHGFCKKKGKLEEACKYFELMVDEGIPPYDTTVELLRNKLVGRGLAGRVDGLADKMDRSTSQGVRDKSGLMRGGGARVKSRDGVEFEEEMESEDESRAWYEVAKESC